MQLADFLTGPRLLRIALLSYRNTALSVPELPAIKVLEPQLIFPNSWMDGQQPACDLRQPEFDAKACKGLYPDAFAVTFFAHSWR